MKKAKISPKFYPWQLVTTIGPKRRDYRVRSITIYSSTLQYNLWDWDENYDTVYENEIEAKNKDSKIGYYINI